VKKVVKQNTNTKNIPITNIQNVTEKISEEHKYGGQITEITYTLPSENKRQYAPKLNILKEDFEILWDQTILEFGEVKTVKGKKGNIGTFVISTLAEAEAKYGKGHWKVKAWEKFTDLIIELPNIENLEKVLTIAKSQKSPNLVSLMNNLDNAKKKLIAIGIDFHDLIHLNYTYRCDIDLLEVLVRRLGKSRQEFERIFYVNGGFSIKDSFYVVPDGKTKDVEEALYKRFMDTFTGINMFMRYQYLKIVIDPIFISSSELTPNSKKEIKNFMDACMLQQKSILGTSNIPTTYIKDLEIDSNWFDDIMRLWLSLSDKTIKFLVDLLNAEELLIEIREERSKNSPASIEHVENMVKVSKMIKVHWYLAVDELRYNRKYNHWVNSQNAYFDMYSPHPYKQEFVEKKVGDSFLKYFVSYRSCLLCHGINDDYDSNHNPTSDNFEYEIEENNTKVMHYGWDAYFYIAFTILNLVSNSSPATTQKIINIFNNSIESDLKKVDERLSEALLKVQLKTSISSFLANTYNNILTKYKEILETHKDWREQYSNTKSDEVEATIVVISEKFRKLKELIVGIVEKLGKRLKVSGSVVSIDKTVSAKFNLVLEAVANMLNSFETNGTNALKSVETQIKTMKGKDNDHLKINKDFSKSFKAFEDQFVLSKSEFEKLSDNKKKDPLITRPIFFNLMEHFTIMCNDSGRRCTLEVQKTERGKVKDITDDVMQEGIEKINETIEQGIKVAKKDINELVGEELEPIALGSEEAEPLKEEKPKPEEEKPKPKAKKSKGKSD
jgi:hypothetical protein